MIIPWGTDAPIYHRPIATVGVMVACVLVFAIDPGHRHTEWQLALGDGLHPVQWATHIFIHQGIGHLLGNLLFLWAFGIIVEGKLGAIGFLAAYLILGIFPGALIQALVSREEVGHAMGASGAIFGLMALCLIWAPRNDLYCLVILGGFMRMLVFQPEIPILWFAAFYIVWDVVKVSTLSIAGVAWVGGLGHSFGALGGVLLGLALLKLDLVDCEGWDLLSRMKHGRTGTMHRPTKRKPHRSFVEKAQKKLAKAKKAKQAGEAPDVVALRTLRGHLDAEETEAALSFYRTTRRRLRGWRPPDPERVDLIKALVAAQAWEEAAGVMQAYLDESNLPSPKIRLKLAEVLIRRLERPVAGLRTIERLPESDLPGNLVDARRKLVTLAEQLREEGVLELDDAVQPL
ncbi:rhomboid family intramembrane serine protease [Planctomyces sp. SH-PL62]|uniref:rhomboid family intramembrane serine protease n=1 Tax=Planctomyces sp. SH-PL62 TaxID=1636152 RepID=UPI00078C91E9|nr:rhomboid family intramembrane serine protease [Planctomyces sp. SH-PL62]AMV37212.1 Rhomboid protease GluP [Planctomyces sp. SH-PL62]